VDVNSSQPGQLVRATASASGTDQDQDQDQGVGRDLVRGVVRLMHDRHAVLSGRVEVDRVQPDSRAPDHLYGRGKCCELLGGQRVQAQGRASVGCAERTGRGERYLPQRGCLRGGVGCVEDGEGAFSNPDRPPVHWSG